MRGGPIAALRDGDELTIDVDARRIDVGLSDEQIAQRLRDYAPPERSTGVRATGARPPVEVAIQKYAKLVGSASEGAITR